MEILSQLAAAAVPMLAIGFLAVIAVLCVRLVGYARQARHAAEDARLIESLLADGFSPQDADEAVRSTREDDRPV